MRLRFFSWLPLITCLIAEPALACQVNVSVGGFIGIFLVLIGILFLVGVAFCANINSIGKILSEPRKSPSYTAKSPGEKIFKIAVILLPWLLLGRAYSGHANFFDASFEQMLFYTAAGAIAIQGLVAAAKGGPRHFRKRI